MVSQLLKTLSVIAHHSIGRSARCIFRQQCVSHFFHVGRCVIAHSGALSSCLCEYPACKPPPRSRGPGHGCRPERSRASLLVCVCRDVYEAVQPSSCPAGLRSQSRADSCGKRELPPCSLALQLWVPLWDLS